MSIPPGSQASFDRDADLMVISLATSGPAEQVGVLPGDILPFVEDTAAPYMRAMVNALGSRIAGMGVAFRLLRGGTPIELPLPAAARPAA